MSKSNHTNLYLTIVMILLLMLISFGCIRHEMTECPVPTHTHSFLIKVVDPFTGEDLTTSGEVENSSVFFFDYMNGFIKSVDITAEQIRNREKIFIELEHKNPIWVSTWGNFTGKHEILFPPLNGIPEQGIIYLITDQDDFATPADDLFFGETTLSESADTENTILISRKNARLHITARNLQREPNDNYYFVITGNNHGYNFKGIPSPIPIKFKESGNFLPNNDFISTSVLNVIHTHKEVNYDYITISVYKINNDPDGNDILLGTAFSDINGKFITPQAGETTNILIDFEQEIKVYIEITSWNEIYHWIKW